ncbi:EAL domain-containing protein [Vibrio aquaticus]|uniref:EAL domain-containing protein n=1 Tax=Vibrio aquaticus TaxID=2496559 RepID=A0A3S0Q300_9VIBR|nr:EAL domain-containing protein [Vibrio aquaticus]RTZ17257.1 EAL domain-containing protein [Vibrio aquaticus]
MFSLAALLIVTGIVFLCLGLNNARKICVKTKRKGWQLLSALIASFIAGYSLVLGSLLLDGSVDPVLFVLSVILFSGSLFVFIVTKFSLATIEQLDALAKEEKYNSLHDSLTGLPNRKHCIETINVLIEHHVPFHLLLLDVVNFKQVNDGMGHFSGDQLLIQIGKRMENHLARGDFLARIGGDEFVIILPKRKERASKEFARAINASLKQPFLINGFELTSGAKIGISHYPDQANDADQIINAADMAMYWGKAAEHDVAVFSSEMYQNNRKRLSISNQIDHALEHNDINVYYQPIVGAKSNKVEGYEALIRCYDEHGEMINPAELISVAEQSHKITSITQWMLDKVAQDIKTLRNQGLAHCAIHVNLSAKDLMSQNIENQLGQLASNDPNFANMVCLEITETTAINRLRSPEKLLKRLKEMGFRITLDDFGTGYSSLSLLRDLPVDQIKIDKSFAYQLDQNERNFSIVENAISLAHGLGYTVVVEGIESREVESLVKKSGSDFMQGYYYSAALPLEDVISWTLSRDNIGYASPSKTDIKKAAP